MMATRLLKHESYLFIGFFLRFRRKNNQHTFSFHFGHAFQHACFLEAVGKLQQQKLTSFLELNGAALELNIGLNLVTVFQELFSMLAFKIKVVVIGSRRKPDLLYLRHLGLGLHFLFLLLLLVKELVVINDLANG